VKKTSPESGMLRSGELARLSGVSADTLRHYERKGLLAPRRSPNGYREYPRQALDRVRLIRSALAIGFKLDDLARVLKVRDAGGAPCHQVRALAQAKLEEIETFVREATAMRDELRALLKDWDGRLSSTAESEPARLLESLAATSLADRQSFAPLKPHRKKHKQERK
jgi:DNA-binding transcriptional MerR regulator